MSTYAKHLAAVMAGRVTKSNVIGIRKAINAAWRKTRGYSISSTAPNWSANDIAALESALSLREPLVTGELHASGMKLLQSRRYRKRWNERTAFIISTLNRFHLVGFHRIGRDGSHCVPLYRACSTSRQSFEFINIPWQTADAFGEPSGPQIRGEDF